MRWREGDDIQTRFCGCEIPENLHRKMKIEAATRGCTMKQLLAEALALVYGGGVADDRARLPATSDGRNRMVPTGSERINL
ncbi:MAG TPA: hypothetical protein PLS90_16500 [Candidatus Sumerlaeota bacterium]|nr:hypothetical protein [Candidatus Sumerlaeota bacterium]